MRRPWALDFLSPVTYALLSLYSGLTIGMLFLIRRGFILAEYAIYRALSAGEATTRNYGINDFACSVDSPTVAASMH